MSFRNSMPYTQRIQHIKERTPLSCRRRWWIVHDMIYTALFGCQPSPNIPLALSLSYQLIFRTPIVQTDHLVIQPPMHLMYTQWVRIVDCFNTECSRDLHRRQINCPFVFRLNAFIGLLGLQFRHPTWISTNSHQSKIRDRDIYQQLTC